MSIQPYFPYLVTGTAVMTDDIFNTYNGQTGTSSQAQRDAAYMMAEQAAINEIGTFLVPTTMSGTFAWPGGETILQLPHTHVRSVGSITAIHEAGCDCSDDQVEISGCAWILDYQAGIVDLRECANTVAGQSLACTCYAAQGQPIQYQIVYEAGIATGQAAANPSVLMALATASDLALQQIVDPAGAEGGPGDPSITNFSDTGYSESRQYLNMTSFGGSPRANYAANLLAPLKYKTAFRL